MPKQLSERQQRLVIAAIIAALVGFGLYLYFSSAGGGEADDEEADTGEQEQQAEPSPMTVTDAEDMEFFDWVPFTEDEFLAAAVTAREFAAAYGTFDADESEADYTERLAELAAEDYAEALQQTSGAGAALAERRDAEATAEGFGEVAEIRYFDAESIVFVVDAQSITEDSEGARESLGEFAVTVVREGGEWRVHDFQPADAGDVGEER